MPKTEYIQQLEKNMSEKELEDLIKSYTEAEQYKQLPGQWDPKERMTRAQELGRTNKSILPEAIQQQLDKSPAHLQASLETGLRAAQGPMKERIAPHRLAIDYGEGNMPEAPETPGWEPSGESAGGILGGMVPFGRKAQGYPSSPTEDIVEAALWFGPSIFSLLRGGARGAISSALKGMGEAGSWSGKELKGAFKEGATKTIASGKGGYTKIPKKVEATTPPVRGEPTKPPTGGKDWSVTPEKRTPETKMNVEALRQKFGVNTEKAIVGYLKANPKLSFDEAVKNLMDMLGKKSIGRQKGGPVKKGQAAIVGETGPELIIPKGDVEIIPSDWGTRADSTPKGPGFLGTLQRPDRKISTEISIGVKIGGKETEVPTLVPTLTQEEIAHLLGGGTPTKEIVDKAVEHARKRISQGQSPFAGEGEQASLSQELYDPNKALSTGKIGAGGYLPGQFVEQKGSVKLGYPEPDNYNPRIESAPGVPKKVKPGEIFDTHSPEDYIKRCEWWLRSNLGF